MNKEKVINELIANMDNTAVKCYICGCKDKLLLKDYEEGDDIYICVDDRNKKMLKQLETTKENENTYDCRWRLRNEKGETRVESFKCDGLEDFERIYGNNVDTILWVTLRKKGQAMF